MKYNTSLYMFAIMPPDGLASTIHQLRQEFFQFFKFRKALKPPVHITLFDPFLIPIELSQAFEQYIAQIQHWASTQSPFMIDLRNFNFFNNREHPVVYIDVINNFSIKKFYAGFINQLTKYKLKRDDPRSFKPHITIGYKDIPPTAFPKIKEHYSKKNFGSSFTCNTFYLWKHDGNNWQVIKTYLLDGKVEQLNLF
jgi:2'-5' RNA ligase